MHLSVYLFFQPSIHLATHAFISSLTLLAIFRSSDLCVHLSIHLPVYLTKTTSERPKCLRDPQFLTLLTSKCASRHNAVHFFDISTSKSAPRPSVFNTFDFEMCFAPQRRALFRHLNFQKCSETASF